MSLVRCDECKYWNYRSPSLVGNPNAIKPWGRCHRYPPKDLENYDEKGWPKTKPDSFCGEGILKRKTSPKKKPDRHPTLGGEKEFYKKKLAR